jgi:hypothetical protein
LYAHHVVPKKYLQTIRLPERSEQNLVWKMHHKERPPKHHVAKKEKGKRDDFSWVSVTV